MYLLPANSSCSLVHSSNAVVCPCVPELGWLIRLPAISGAFLVLRAEETLYQSESEFLGMPVDKGCGYEQFKFGEKIGPDSRYAMSRKLGWGVHSSV
jgi:hypothetical protein